MTDFATDLLWEEAKQPVLPVPGHPRDRQQEKKPVGTPAQAAPVESLAERLQRVAGNAALAREAEEAAAAQKRIAEVARQPEKVPASTPVPKPKTKPAKQREEHAAAKAATDPKSPAPERKKAADKQAATIAVKVAASRLPEATKAAAARAAALAQVLASFDNDAGKADLLTLALLVEKATPGIAEDTARALTHAVTRADPAQRVVITERIKVQLGNRHDLRLARLLADRLAGFAMAPPHAAPPPPPPPPPPSG